MESGRLEAHREGVVIRSLTKNFKSRRVVDDVSFTVEPGKITGFLGPNGAGKTTTLRMIVGLVTPTSGSALIGGKAYRELPAPGRTVGALLDATGIDPGRRGRDHLRVYAPSAGVDDRRVDEVLDLVGLSEAATQRVRGYSLGMRQRLALATAMLADPQVLICDEPTNGLDPDGIRWLRSLLREQAARGKTVLVSSHLLAEMQQTVDSVVILNRGKIVYSGAMQDMGGSIRVRTSDNAVLANALQALNHEAITIETGPAETLILRGVDSTAVGQAARDANVIVFEMTPVSSDLEHLFITLTNGSGETQA